ncbi:inositol monophosphatase family protein [Streptosporangium sp. NPDC050855]|uniref:inositol monophosphatase family protein n=1 Tax=Streptosporangium sp. NPDC050855 TaxID=3366194 RepID=UPI0037AB7662
MDPNVSADLAAVAVEAARTAGDRLREVFRSRPAVETKSDFHDPVTEHDHASEHIIREIIERRVPGSTVIGEEGGSEGSGEIRWYVDPIDGTANFAVGLPFFCVSIAAAVGDEVVAGVIYDPARDDEFRADLTGAWCNGVPLRSAGAVRDREAVLLTSYPFPAEVTDGGEETLRRFGRMLTSFASTRRPGSTALKLAHVAAGWADVAYGSRVSPWDMAAGSLLIRQAGGVFIPLKGSVFEPGGYLAHVGGFDLAGSVMSELVLDGRPA